MTDGQANESHTKENCHIEEHKWKLLLPKMIITETLNFFYRCNPKENEKINNPNQKNIHGKYYNPSLFTKW